MKKLISLFAIFTLLFVSCDPLEDINSEIDANIAAEKKINGVLGNETYTLADKDYTTLKITNAGFASLDEAKALLPNFLTNLYPTWGKLSGVLVNYNLKIGNAEGVSNYTSAASYSLVKADYPKGSFNALAFYPKENPKTLLPQILKNALPSAVEGDVRLVKYKRYSEEPVSGIASILNPKFDGALDGFTPVSVVGDAQLWKNAQFGSDQYAIMTGYDSATRTRIQNEDWLVSPTVDLSGQSNAKFSVRQAINFASGELDRMKILVSSNYSGNVATATWEEITLTNTPAGTSYTFVTSEDYSLAAYNGLKINIAFKYTSSDVIASTWQVDEMAIKVPGVTGDTYNEEAYYEFKGGKWVLSTGVYFVQDADFDMMGEGPGQPGQFNNFSSSVSASDYLPKFLGTKAPYAFAKEKDQVKVCYDYFSSSTGVQVRGNLYTFTNGVWVEYKSTIASSLQFAHDGTKWVPDNTIPYKLVKADYEYIVTTLASKYPDQTSNMANFGNFNGFTWKEEMFLDAIESVLKKLNPTAAEGQKYSVTLSAYRGSTADEIWYVILKDGKYVKQ